MTTWSAQTDTTPEMIQAMQAGLTVRLIMTARGKLMTCSPNDFIDSLKAANIERFSVLPVVQSASFPVSITRSSGSTWTGHRGEQ